MLKILLVRHSMTYGNTLGRYIGGRTDEPLCQKGIELLQGKCYPKASVIYVSPMRRCVETAQYIWGEAEDLRVVADFRECDFGEFENKNYQELSGNPAYQAWIDSNGTLPFPDGEETTAFKERCQRAFAALVWELRELEKSCTEELTAAVVVHGGTIMSILEQFGYPKKGYYDYQVKNGCGYVLTPVEGTEFWNCQYEDFCDTI